MNNHSFPLEIRLSPWLPITIDGVQRMFGKKLWDNDFPGRSGGRREGTVLQKCRDSALEGVLVWKSIKHP